MPAVSVIVVAWNCGDHLLEAIGSVLDQTQRDLEVILVDNGSGDGSVDRLEAARPDPRLRVFRQGRNLGIAAGTNLGVAQATGQWIAIMDGDDRAHPMRLDLALRAAQADPTLDVIATGAVRIDAAGREEEPVFALHEPAAIAGYVRYHMPVAHPTLHVKREVFARVKYRECASICADYDWLSRVVEAGFRVGSVSVPLLGYRRHGRSTTITRHVRTQAEVSAVRLAQRRRAAGRPDGFEALCAEAGRLAERPDGEEAAFGHFARCAAREGFWELAAFQAALACRVGRSPGNLLRFWWYLARSIAAERGAWREALPGVGKGPFWVMLRRAGFPLVPKY